MLRAMAKRFDEFLQDEIRKTETCALDEISLGDSHLHAYHKGVKQGLTIALNETRRRRRSDDTEEDQF